MKKYFLLLVTLTWVDVSVAAIPQKFNAAIEILQMPPENRKNLVQKQPDKIYKDFISLAFDANQSMSLRWKALMAGAQMRKKEATPDLVKASRSDQWFMRNAAIEALAEYNPLESMVVAEKLLKDKALVVRSAAVNVIAKDMASHQRDLLWEELHQKYNFKNKKSLWIRPQIVEALAKSPKDEETTLFTNLLKESELSIQILAVRGLEKLTGMKLGQNQTPPAELVKLWRKKQI